MGKKRRKRKSAFRKGWRASPQQVEAWLKQVKQQLVAEKYKSAAQNARRILRHVPERSRPGGEALRLLGAALGLLYDYEESYQVLTKALDVQPEDANVWYNRALSGRFTARTGQSLRDLERAVELERNPKSRKIYEDALSFAHEIVQQQLDLRGPDFTLDQLVEQQEMFLRGIELMREKQWAEAEVVFRRVIEMGYVPPQPWGNLGGCLIMQERYDEAEEALRRALELEPGYEIARQNLEMLPYIRQHGSSVMGTRIKPAFEGHEVNPGAIFIEE